MLLNLSNHPSTFWTVEQRDAAETAFGEVVDIPFPTIPPEWGPDDVKLLAMTTANHCFARRPAAVHVMGELTFCLAFVAIAQPMGLRCIASTTDRLVKELPDGSRNVTFRFVRFRDYLLPTP